MNEKEGETESVHRKPAEDTIDTKITPEELEINDTNYEKTESTERAPTLAINPKGIHNSYLRKHLLGKRISYELIEECLSDGEDVTDEMKHTKEGSRYLRIDVPDGAGMPGRFVLPNINGPLGEKVANWNCPCEFKFRHGRLSPVLKRDQLPEWLVNYASALYVIVERNELPNGRLQIKDGPTEDDPEGSWVVSTAHFGPPSRQKPRIPKDCSDGKSVKRYLEELDTYDREQSSIIFVDLEEEGTVGPVFEEDLTHGDKREARLMSVIGEQQQKIDELLSAVKGLQTRGKKQQRGKRK